MKNLTKIITAALVLFAAPMAMGQYSFTFNCDRPAKAGPVSGITMFEAPLVNTGADDSFTIVLTSDVPEGWNVSLCIDSLCYEDSLDWSVNGGESITVMPEFSPMTITGDGTAIVRVRSINNPGDEKQLMFFHASGADYLLVCGDPDNNYVEYYAEVFERGDVPYNNWPRWFAPLHEEDLQYFKRVFWYTGDAENTLTTEDFDIMNEMPSYGIKMFITGQNIAEDLQGEAFLEDFLRTSYVGMTTSRLVLGIQGDTISNGFIFSISGNNGANNQDSPDVISPVNGSSATFNYSDGSCAGIKYEEGDFKLVFLGFGFEAINSAQTRYLLGCNVRHYFGLVIVDADEPLETMLPEKMQLVRNYPNPFNAQTKIEIDIPVKQNVTVAVYDIAGRLVDEIHNGVLDAGRHFITWDAADKASGIYYCRVIGQDVKSLPMVLIK